MKGRAICPSSERAFRGQTKLADRGKGLGGERQKTNREGVGLLTNENDKNDEVQGKTAVEPVKFKI